MLKGPSRTTLIRTAAGIALAALLAGLAPVLAATGTAQAPAEIPPVLYADVPPRLDLSLPFWLAANEAIDSEGKVTDELSDVNKGVLESILRDHVPGRCIEVTESYDNYPWLKGDTLAEVIATSDLVLSGTVTASAPGFQLAEPGQLFRLELDRAYKGSANLDYYFFFVPIGRFKAGPYEICKTDVRFPGAPTVGDRVVLIVPKTRNPAEHYLNISYDGSTVLLRGNDVLLPKNFQNEGLGATTPPQFLEWVEDQVGEGPPR